MFIMSSPVISRSQIPDQSKKLRLRKLFKHFKEFQSAGIEYETAGNVKSGGICWIFKTY
jgi:hypothetical protein